MVDGVGNTSTFDKSKALEKLKTNITQDLKVPGKDDAQSMYEYFEEKKNEIRLDKPTLTEVMKLETDEAAKTEEIGNFELDDSSKTYTSEKAKLIPYQPVLAQLEQIKNSSKIDFNKLPQFNKAMYRVFADLIDQEIRVHFSKDESLSSDPKIREKFANEVMLCLKDLRTEYRKPNASFKEIDKIINKYIFNQSTNTDKTEDVAIKQLEWMQRAYLFLNQSNLASSYVMDPRAGLEPKKWADKIYSYLSKNIGLSNEEIKKVFKEDMEVGMVLTAHPTSGINGPYWKQFQEVVSYMQNFTNKHQIEANTNLSNLLKRNPSVKDELYGALRKQIRKMIGGEPYNKKSLRPSDEMKTYLDVMTVTSDIVADRLNAIEQMIRKKTGDENYKINDKLYTYQLWTAMDIDGNRAITRPEHLISILDARKASLFRFQSDLEALRDNETNSELVKKYETMVNKIKPVLNKTNELYEYIVKETKDKTGEKQEAEVNSVINYVLDEFKNIGPQALDIKGDILSQLKEIKDSQGLLNTSTDLDKLIKKINIFGNYGALGHTRQLRDAMNVFAEVWTGQKAIKGDQESIDKVSKYISSYEDNYNGEKITRELGDAANTILSDSRVRSLPKKVQDKLPQTMRIWQTIHTGAISTQVISMANSFADLMNPLALAKKAGLFTPAKINPETNEVEKLPNSKLRIFPLLEQVQDLDNAANVAIEALSNPAYRQYVIGNNGEIGFMFGPSDSGKMNGPQAAQWYIRKARIAVNLVVKIFNAVKNDYVNSDDKQANLEVWQRVAEKAIAEGRPEGQIIAKAINEFAENLKHLKDAQDPERQMWQKAALVKDTEAKDPLEVKYVDFGGVGGTQERGWGAQHHDTEVYTAPPGLTGNRIRTVQGSDASVLTLPAKARQVFNDYLRGASKVAAKKVKVDSKLKKAANVEAKADVILNTLSDPDFTKIMDQWIKIQRSELRRNIFGLKLNTDEVDGDEGRKTLKEYLTMVFHSPLPWMGLFHNASRTISRSGNKLVEKYEQKGATGLLDFIQNLSDEEMIEILDDIRAIPFVAKLNLMGGNITPYYGLDKVMNSDAGDGKTLGAMIRDYLHNPAYKDKPERIFLHYLVNSIEEGLIYINGECFKESYKQVRSKSGVIGEGDYAVADDKIVNKILAGQQAGRNFVAFVKDYKKLNKEDQKNHNDNFRTEELKQGSVIKEKERALDLSRGITAVSKFILAKTLGMNLEANKSTPLNPMQDRYLGLFRSSIPACQNGGAIDAPTSDSAPLEVAA